MDYAARMTRVLALLLPALSLPHMARAAENVPATPKAWSDPMSQELLAKTQTVRLAPDLSSLTPGERTAVAKLIEAGQIFQDIYELSRHRQALAVRAKLEAPKGRT